MIRPWQLRHREATESPPVADWRFGPCLRPVNIQSVNGCANDGFHLASSDDWLGSQSIRRDHPKERGPGSVA